MKLVPKSLSGFHLSFKAVCCKAAISILYLHISSMWFLTGHPLQTPLKFYVSMYIIFSHYSVSLLTFPFHFFKFSSLFKLILNNLNIEKYTDLFLDFGVVFLQFRFVKRYRRLDK